MKKLPKFLIAVSIAAAVSGCSSWVYGTSNAPKPAELPKVDNLVKTDVLWSKNLGKGGGEYSLAFKPAAIGNTVYAVSENGNFYSINAESGKENYHVKLGNLLLVGTKNGSLMALDASDGHTVWRTPLNAMMLSPAAFDGNIIAVHTAADSVIGIDPADGTVLWRYQSSSPNLTLRGNSSPVVGGGAVIVTTDNGFFTVLDEKTGLPLANERVVNTAKNSKTADLLIDQNASPQINNAVLFGSAYQNLVYAIDLQAGQPKWQNESLSSAQDFAISPTDIYLITPEGTLAALSQANGQEIWRNDAFRGRRLSPPAAIPGRVGAVDYQGYLSWFDAADGKLLAVQRIGADRAASAPLILQNVIVWQLADGRLVALRPQ